MEPRGNVKLIPIADLVYDKENPRDHESNPANRRVTLESIRKHGQIDLVVVQAGTNWIIHGNLRTECMAALGYEEARCIVVDATDAEARELSHKLNRSGELAGWKADVVIRQLEEIVSDDVSLEDIGWDDESFAELQSMLEKPAEPDKPREPKQHSIIQVLDDGASIHLGDCREMMKEMADESVDALVCDPPYGLSKPPDIREVLAAWMAGEEFDGGKGFMGQEWDGFVPGPTYWSEVFRVMKPGAHGVVFAGQRTLGLMDLALRLAGFEVRDTMGWIYFSGFPKSHDISKAIDDIHGAAREVVGTKQAGIAVPGETGRHTVGGSRSGDGHVHAPATPDAQAWDGWGTALKPVIEPCLLIRKPVAEDSIARQVLATGTGGIHIDACRHALGDPGWIGPQDAPEWPDGEQGWRDAYVGGNDGSLQRWEGHDLGRFPSNCYACPKPSRSERERGTDGLSVSQGADAALRDGGRGAAGVANHHPTVKPVRLMRWLCRLVTPPGGLVLDPFTGSGTCGIAATLEGFRYAGAELNEDYHPIAMSRISHAQQHPNEWEGTATIPSL